MAGMNLKQIIDKLNDEFKGDNRKLVFWYDKNAEFQDDIDTMEFENAKILRLKKDNQFYVKHFLECEDTKTNYLIYAPFEKPNDRENHLLDTILYSKEFFADRATLIALDLGINDKFIEVINAHIQFFRNKERTKKFYELDIEHYNKETIELGLMSSICNNKIISIEEILRTILCDNFEKNTYLSEFEKYNLTNAFWESIDKNFGYNDSNPTLKKLVITMFVTYATKILDENIPKIWEQLISYKLNNIIVFLDGFKNNYLYKDIFNKISKEIYVAINGKEHFGRIDISELINFNLFEEIDNLIIQNLIQRLENEDIGAKYNGLSIPEVCTLRRKGYYGKNFKNEYLVIENAFYIISKGIYCDEIGIKNIVNRYLNEEYKIDKRYRYFYYYYDRLDNKYLFENLKELVENIYTNKYLNPIIVNWNKEFMESKEGFGLIKQKDFYNEYIKYSSSRVVVIISDALRYEVGHSLCTKLQANAKCEATINALQGVLPSYTSLGMASLLPYGKIEFNSSYDVLIDEKPCKTTFQRQTILQGHKKNSVCIQFDVVKNMKQAELRTIFTGKEVVYVYHNQIDARGDNAATENEVFNACEEAIDEIYKFILRISSQANTHNFIITSDHGFIYKRNKIQANDKIKGEKTISNSVGQRYVIGDSKVNADGVCSITIGEILENNDKRVISFPLGSDIFKVSGSGQNYVHGGSSPQEMIIPIIEVKVERGKIETTKAKLDLVSPLNKITNLITVLEFVQTEPVSAMVKKANYRVYFVSENNEKISNENIIVADKKETETIKRKFRLRFNFKNKSYNRLQKYYLVIYDDKEGLEVYRKEVIIDIVFADDFGFSV